jgi:hypothetical protein
MPLLVNSAGLRTSARSEHPTCIGRFSFTLHKTGTNLDLLSNPDYYNISFLTVVSITTIVRSE